MQAGGLAVCSFVAVLGPEAARGGVEVTGALVVEAEVFVPLLTSIEIGVRGRAGVFDQDAVGVVGITIADRGAGVGQGSGVAAAVVEIVMD